MENNARLLRSKYKKIKYYILLFVLLFLNNNVFSQDIIIKYNRDTIYCNILEINTKTIKYDSTKYSTNLIFEINRSEVLKVFFKNKEEINLYKDSLSFDAYNRNKKNALKLYLLSPVMGHIGISYERSIRLGASLEFGASIIYGRYQHQKTEKGGTARLGYKFIKLRDYSKYDVRFVHIMKGSYIKPELIFSAFNSRYDFINEFGYTETHSDDVFSYAFLLNYGVQYIYDNLLLVDFYVGLGGGISSSEADFYYSNASIKSDPHDFCFSMTMGIKIGGLF